MLPSSITQRRLRSQRLTGAGFRRITDAVAHLGAVQAQDYALAKWALGLRVPGTTDADVERAFADGTILRTHVLRPTWHFVTPADIRWLLALTAPRVHQVNASIYRKIGLDRDDVRRCRTALTRVLGGHCYLERDELRASLRQAGVRTDGELRMSYVLMHAELDGLVCSGPRRGKQFTYALLDERAPFTKAVDRRDALVELARRFFTSRGPATPHDFAKWSGLTLADARQGLEGAGRALGSEVIDGRTCWFAPRRAGQAPRAATAHLLSIYDEYISGYKDRRDIIAAPHAARLRATGGALTAIVIVDGRVVGSWKRRLRKQTVDVVVDYFVRLTKAQRAAVTTAIEKFVAF